MGAAPGQWVTETIELIAPIAQGAMGKVWVAYHHGLHTRVAVKFVADGIRDDSEEALKRFRLEARTASQIKSPHVVQTFDSGVSRFGAPYIVMELLEGETLQDRIRNSGPLSVAEATKILSQVGRALSRAHEQGIIHRDIKPANIFLTQAEGSIFSKVLDFGLAKQTRLPAMGGLTTDGKLVGTPEYMSPEQVLENHDVDYRADLWALAVVIYVCLTGHMPFTGRTLGQLCINLVNKPAKPPSAHRPDLPSSVDRWMARALHRKADRRFASARDMVAGFAADSLAPFDAVESVTDRSSLGAVVPTTTPPRSWTTAAAGATVAASIALAIGAASLLTSGSGATSLVQPAWAGQAIRMTQEAAQPRREPRSDTEVSPTSDETDGGVAKGARADGAPGARDGVRHGGGAPAVPRSKGHPEPAPAAAAGDGDPKTSDDAAFPSPPRPAGATAPKPASASDKRRGKSELGF
ncbi:MAG: serine/threonine-protein kinase [Myxococcota bacterium]